MSSSTIAMSENNIENISNTPAIFGESKPESLNNRRPTPVFETKSSLPQNQNCVPHTNEKHSTKPGNMKEIRSSGGANHILRPAKIENLKQNLSKNPSTGKSVIKSNHIEKISPPTIVGASGDGLQHNEKIKLLNNSEQLNNSNPNKSDKNSENLHASKTAISNESLSNKTTMPQTYARAAQNLNTNSKSECNIVFEGKPGPAVSQYKGILKSVDRTTILNETPVMNGTGTEENASTSSPPPVTFLSSESLVDASNDDKALKETIGHVSSRLPDDQRLTDIPQSNDREFQSLSNSERATEDESLDAFLQQDGAMNSIDGDGSLKLNMIRREAEKPPRMQKQRSQDRLLAKQQKPSFDADVKREALSREPSIECVDSMGVDVHEFLVNTLRNSSRDRAILMKIEHDMIAFVNDKTIDFMKFPPMTSYHRMLVHRVAAYFGMDHNVDETGKSVIINKTSSTRIPEGRFADQFDPRQPDQHSSRRDDDMRRRSILKRTNQSRSFDRDDMKGALWKDSQQRSIEEREEQYEKVRARIFNNPEANMHSPPMYGRRGVSTLATARMASWSERPWNSTDLEPMSSGVRMPLTRPLTTRASSYSSISVLPRHNSATSVKTGSSTSVSSMNGVNPGFTQGRQPPNSGNPGPPTPVGRSGGSKMGDNNNGTYYYMQQQNQGMPYLSPEGYQLVYQGGQGTAGGPGMTSPQFARYYQMPPQPSPQHPGMTYPQGYNHYQESPQKAASMSHGNCSTDYSMVAPMSTYPQNLSSTTTVYSAVHGQQNMSYAYQPPSAVQYRSSQDQVISSVPVTQTGIHQMSHNANLQAQGKNTQVVQGGPNYIQQQVPSPGYPSGYIIAPPPNATGPHQQVPSVLPPTGKDGTLTQNSVTPKMVMAQPVQMMQQVPPIYQQQPTQVLYSPHASTVNPTLNNADGYQNVQNNATKSSNHSQDAKKIAEDELNEKMQAIVLKNMQQQHGQMPESVVPDASITVTTSVSPSIHGKQPQTVAESAGQNRMSTHTGQHGHAADTQGYQYQYTNTNGIQQPMQVYLMPTNAQTANGASYRTYSQFMSQPQTPHVMGPGMHFVYLSPPPVMGMDAASNIAVPPPAQIMHNHRRHQQAPEVGQVYPNTNNNNTQSVNVENHQVVYNTQESRTSNVSGGSTIDATQNSVANIVQNQTEGTDTDSVVQSTDIVSPELNPIVVEGSAVLSNCHAPASSNEKNSELVEMSDMVPSSNNAEIAAQVLEPNTNESHSNSSHSITAVIASSSANSTHPTNEQTHYQTHGHHHHHPAVVQHANTPMILSNMPLDYRMAGMGIGNAGSYPSGVIPQYPMYPGMNPSPYVYLPAATSRSPKLQEVKMFPPQATASHSPGLIAVQLPNQNQIQLVPAASLQQNQIYYSPNNYMPADYTNQTTVSAPHQTYVKQEISPHIIAALLKKDIPNFENVEKQEMVTENAAPDSTSEAAKSDEASTRKTSSDVQ